MPWFYFDLVIDSHPHDQGGMILEDIPLAKERAESFVRELRIARPELHGKRCYIRVTDDDSKEVHRVSLDPTSTWSIATVQR